MASVPEPWTKDYRLSPHVVPLHYDLLLHPDLKSGTFSGNVTIRVRVEQPREFVAVHVKRLNITSTRVTVFDSGAEFSLEEAIPYALYELWVLKTKFPIGKYLLHFQFNGKLTDKIVGFYRSEYVDTRTKNRRYIATSKFQPTYARQAFPCFDEPSFKSTFTIQVVRPSGDNYNALSNMDIREEVANQPSAGLTTVYFSESVPMVTYLACFIVSDFVSLDPKTITGNVPFRVYSSPEQVEKTQYSLDSGVDITEYYIEYFDLAYPLPKLDMVAIPDYVSGATEHWGLITYREVNLLYDESVSSTANKQRVATVVAHELAHMWFGNLMTLKWWDDLWLNEGFATYMQYKGVDHIHPDWGMMDQFLTENLHSVLTLDATLASRPIVKYVSNPDEITEIFDTISYNKGAAVLRMLDDFMGEEKFRKGISDFLKEYQFANAITQNLWDILQKVEDDNSDDPLNITEIMDTWTRQMGFPVLTVTLDNNNNRILTQSRFLADPNADTSNDTSPYNYKWDVPVTYITSASTEVRRIWFRSNDESVTIPSDGASWIKFNRHQIGYYRINYPSADWLAFSDLLKNNREALDVSDRVNLLQDAFSLADAGLLDLGTALDMTEYLTGETEYVPWVVASSVLTSLKNLIFGTPAYANMRIYIRYLVTSAYASSTWNIADDDPHLIRRLRGIILDLACSVGHEDCLNEAKTRFEAFLNNPTVRPHPDLRTLVYNYGIEQSGGEKNWDTLWQLYLDEDDAQEKAKLLNAVARVKEPWLLQRLIEYSKDESYIRSQDFFTLITYIARNHVGLPIAWDFLRSEWEYLADRFTLNNRYLGNMVPSITSTFSTEFKLKEMEAFFAQYPEAGAGTAARTRALETTAHNILWRSKHEATLDSWLLSHASVLKK